MRRHIITPDQDIITRIHTLDRHIMPDITNRTTTTSFINLGLVISTAADTNSLFYFSWMLEVATSISRVLLVIGVIGFPLPSKEHE